MSDMIETFLVHHIITDIVLVVVFHISSWKNGRDRWYFWNKKRSKICGLVLTRLKIKKVCMKLESEFSIDSIISN